MGLKDNAKALIDANVYANGQEQITGQGLNATLKGMVDILPTTEEIVSGIKGVATTATVPSATEFERYIVHEAGVYTNFLSGGSPIEVTAADLDVVNGVANNRVILEVQDGVATKRVERVKGDVGVDGAAGKTTEAWTPKAFVSGSTVYQNGAIWESNADTLADDIPGISPKWISRVKPANNYNIAPEFNVFAHQLPSSLAGLQTVNGISINTRLHEFEFNVPLGKYKTTPLNVWINGHIVGTGKVRIRTYQGASLITTQDVNISDFNGNLFIGVLPAGDYDRIYIYFENGASTDYYVKNVYVGEGSIVDSKQSNQDVLNILKSINPIQRAELFLDENRWSGGFEKEDENTFIVAEDLNGRPYRITDLTPFLSSGKMYVSFLETASVENKLGFRTFPHHF